MIKRVLSFDILSRVYAYVSDQMKESAFAKQLTQLNKPYINLFFDRANEIDKIKGQKGALVTIFITSFIR